MKKLKVAVLVSGGGTNLQALINAQNEGLLKHCEIALVLSSNPQAYALERAKNVGIACAAIDKALYKNDNNGFCIELAACLKNAEIDLIVLAGFTCILNQYFVSLYKDRIINVHPSLIPSFCGKGFYGLKVHEAALDYGVKVSGATVHFVNEVVDGGEIIAQKAIDIFPNDTPETLQKRIMEECEWKLLPSSVELVAMNIVNNI